jgi:hypothetical protein
LIATLNDASLEMQALQSSRAVSTVPLTIETKGITDEPTQLCQIAEKVESRLRRDQEDTTQATQALAQVQSAHRVQ